ncbi:MAG: hypothetical protein GF383_14660 [Candidatus Lokiarchaeota archaeon]|nr:hypothetical protein [Candidatus Lokiarchaeota archaeon]MBD3342657.1 hypothetical protein [Candidatus Lokiarchaeota archaeon]
MVTVAAQTALDNLRSTDNLQWYVIPLLIIIVYIYNLEMEKDNKEAVYMGIYWFAISGVVLEIINALVLHFTQYSALWLTPGNSAFVIYVGWNIEIAFLAALIGLMNVKGLPEDKDKKIFGMPNRIFMPILWGVQGVIVEIILNFAGILVWDWWFWNFPNLYFIFIWWTIPNFALVWLHDNLSLEGKKKLAGASVLIAISCHIIFAVILQWV